MPQPSTNSSTTESGLLGISETSADMRDLLAQEAQDERARDAVELFCYQVRKWIGAYSGRTRRARHAGVRRWHRRARRAGATACLRGLELPRV